MSKAKLFAMVMALGITMAIPATALADSEDANKVDEGNILLQDGENTSQQAAGEEIDGGNILMYSGAPEGGVETGEGSEGTDGQTTEGEGEQTPAPTDGEGESAQTVGKGKIMGSDVKVRAEANTNAEIKFQLSNGTEVDIQKVEGEWLYVKYGIVEGYVYGQYVFQIDGTGRNGTILEDDVNMREDASTGAAVVKTLAAGYGVKVVDYKDGWFKIEFEGATGYVTREYIEVTGAFTGESKVRVLKKNMSGEAISKMQKELKRRGFFIGETTQDFGDKTYAALVAFQKAAKVEADGVAGPSTLDLLYGDNNIMQSVSEKDKYKGQVKMTVWDEVNKTIARGEEFKVIDVNTGISWRERRMGGWYHIDTEPVTAEDSAKMKKAYGGSWSWDRRAVWVVYGNNVYAASMNGMPHLGSTIGGNNFNGHHCIHFYKSKVHANSKQCPRHQAKVQEAYAQGN